MPDFPLRADAGDRWILPLTPAPGPGSRTAQLADWYRGERFPVGERMEKHLDLFLLLNRAECDLDNLRAAWQQAQREEDRNDLRDRAADVQAHIDDLRQRMSAKPQPVPEP
jgi:hypothetical protein